MISQANQQQLITTPRPGDYWHGQGGVFAGAYRLDGHIYGLILATNSAAENICGKWGPLGKRIDGADSYVDGLANMQAMIAAGNDHPIVEQIRALNIDGHSDFYWPAQREQNLLLINTPEFLNKGWHWSSTQYDAGYAWDQDFENGHQDVNDKDNSRAARAVRRLLIQ
jgi:hypothetical protein